MRGDSRALPPRQRVVGQGRDNLLGARAARRRGHRRAKRHLIVLGAEARAGTEEQGLNAARGRAKGGGHLVVAQAADLAHGEGGAVRRRQAAQRPPHQIPLLRSQPHRLRRAPTCRVGIRLGHGIAQFGLRQPTALTQRRQGHVRGDARDPRAESVWATQGRQGAQSLKKGILRHIFGLGRVADEVVGQRVYARSMTVEENSEGVFVPVQGLRHELGIERDATGIFAYILLDGRREDLLSHSI